MEVFSAVVGHLRHGGRLESSGVTCATRFCASALRAGVARGGFVQDPRGLLTAVRGALGVLRIQVRCGGHGLTGALHSDGVDAGS